LLSGNAMRSESAGTRKRIQETQQFVHVLTHWADEMLRLEPETLMKVLKLGARVRDFVRRDAKG